MSVTEIVPRNDDFERTPPHDVAAELRRVRDAMLCAPDRPDLAAARELLTRLGGEAAPTREPAEGRVTT